jgi:hypothetical protein
VTAKSRVFWTLLLAVGAFTLLLARFVVPLLAWQVSKQAIQEMFVSSWAHLCVPEPVEQLRFIAAVLAPVGLLFAATQLLKRREFLARLEAGGARMDVLALLAQLLVAIVGTRALLGEVEHGTPFRFLGLSSMASLAAFMAFGLVYGRLSPNAVAKVHVVWQGLHRCGWLAWAFSLFWVVGFALTGLFRDSESQRWPGYLGYHIPFVMDEFVAALNGRTPLVDFFSQYQNLAPLLLTPFFKLAGVSVATFSALMFSLTIIGFMLLYSALCRVCKSAWSALGLFGTLRGA